MPAITPRFATILRHKALPCAVQNSKYRHLDVDQNCTDTARPTVARSDSDMLAVFDYACNGKWIMKIY